MKIDLKKFINKENILKPKVLAFMFLFIGLIVVLIFLTCLNIFLRTPASAKNEETTFVIQSGESVRKIARNLEDSGLVKNDVLLLVYLKGKGLSGDLKAGNYRLAKNNTPLQVVDILTNGKVASIKITIPEGWTNLQISEYLEKKGVVAKDDFLSATKEKYDYDFLKDLPEGASVEGFLFPDTYNLPIGVTAKQIVERMLQNTNNKLTKELKAEIGTTKYNAFETITLASLVEREVSKPEDRKTVAGIFLARLVEGMKLQSDATIQYALNSNKKIFSYSEILVDSPYNTYQIQGLPVGPIGNPGMESILAVLRPQNTEFRYFLSTDGVTYYSKTLDEHEEKKARYLSD